MYSSSAEFCLFNFQAVLTSVSKIQGYRSFGLLQVPDVNIFWKLDVSLCVLACFSVIMHNWTCTFWQQYSAHCQQYRQWNVCYLLDMDGGMGNDSVQLASLTFQLKLDLMWCNWLVCLALDKRTRGTTQAREGGEGTLWSQVRSRNEELQPLGKRRWWSSSQRCQRKSDKYVCQNYGLSFKIGVFLLM